MTRDDALDNLDYAAYIRVMTYAPLDADLLNSSVMLEGPLVLAVWCAVLASKDKDGVTSIKPKTLCALWSRAPDAPTLDAVVTAWEVLRAADPDSANPEHCGARIVPTDDGRWKVVSHNKYRERYSQEKRRTQLVEAQQRLRGKTADSLLLEACALWNAHYGEGSADETRLTDLVSLAAHHNKDVVLAALRRYLNESTHPAKNPQDFKAHFKDWLPDGKGQVSGKKVSQDQTAANKAALQIILQRKEERQRGEA